MNNELVLQPIISKAQPLIEQKTSHIPILAIAGGPGSGKSYTAQLLKTMLEKNGYQTLIIEQDNFSHHDGSKDVLAHISINLKWHLLHEVMQKIIAGEPVIRMPFRIRSPFPYTPQSKAPYRIEYKEIAMSSIDIIILEGAHTLSDARTYNFLPYSNIGIFVDASEDNMRKWRLEREMKKSPELQRPPLVLHDHIEKGIDIFYHYILPTKKNATYILHKEAKDQYWLEDQHLDREK